MIGEHGRSRRGERLVVQGEGADQTDVDPADTAGHRNVSAELSDQVSDDEDPDRGRVAECPEAGAENGEVERHHSERAGQDSCRPLAQRQQRVFDAAPKRAADKPEPLGDSP